MTIHTQYIQSSLPLTLTLTEDAMPNCSLHSNDDGESLTADDNSAWLNRSETTRRDQLIGETLLTKDYCHQGSAVPKTIEQH